MIHRQAKLSPEDIDKINKLQSAITQWSIQHTNLAGQAHTALEQVKAMNLAHAQIMEAAYKVAGIEVGTIQEVRISKDGTVDCICLPPTVPTNGVAPTPPSPPVSASVPENETPTS